MKTLASILIVTFLFAAVVAAHGDLAHVMGTVVAVDEHSVSVKTADGTVKVVTFDEYTHFLKGTTPAAVKDVVVGSRVVIHAHQTGDKYRAVEVKIGMPAPAASAK